MEKEAVSLSWLRRKKGRKVQADGPESQRLHIWDVQGTQLPRPTAKASKSDHIRCGEDVGKLLSSPSHECVNWYDHVRAQFGNIE